MTFLSSFSHPHVISNLHDWLWKANNNDFGLFLTQRYHMASENLEYIGFERDEGK